MTPIPMTPPRAITCVQLHHYDTPEQWCDYDADGPALAKVPSFPVLTECICQLTVPETARVTQAVTTECICRPKVCEAAVGTACCGPEGSPYPDACASISVKEAVRPPELRTPSELSSSSGAQILGNPDPMVQASGTVMSMSEMVRPPEQVHQVASDILDANLSELVAQHGAVRAAELLMLAAM